MLAFSNNTIPKEKKSTPYMLQQHHIFAPLRQLPRHSAAHHSATQDSHLPGRPATRGQAEGCCGQ